jgi:outer membrane protein assembly factor BamA
MKTVFLVILLFFFGINPLISQDSFDNQKDIVQATDTLTKGKSTQEKQCQQEDIGYLFRKKDKPPKPPKKNLILVLPNISSNPSNGFLLGVGGALGWYMGPKETTKVSSSPFTVAVTSKSQLITFLKPNIYTKDNKFYLQGDWRFYIYSQPTYGLGTNAPDTTGISGSVSWLGEGTSTDSLSFPMNYNYLRFHQILNKKVIGELYAGIGYHLDYYYSIEDEKYRPATDSTPVYYTPNSYYSEKYNFSTSSFTLSGISLNVIYDTRDNQINPYKGIYANINYRINPEFLGSSANESSFWLEFRTYLNLSKKSPRHLIGFWAFGDFVLTGSMPYLMLPYIGGDQRARAGRGYTNGRYRGHNLVYGEVEYRFPIWPCTNIIGGVLFANAVTTSNPDRNVALFEYVRPAVGFGLRIMVNKWFRTNINLDYAIGVKSSGFYFSGQETF